MDADSLIRPTSAPTFSVVIPTYDRPTRVARAVASVLRQERQDFELLVVDDASAEAVPVTTHPFDDPRVRHFRHTENRGASAARNTGVAAARGEWIAFLDDDDLYLPGFLDAVGEVTDEAPREVGFLWTGVHKVEEEPGGSVRPIAEDDFQRFRDGPAPGGAPHILSTSFGLVVRRSAFDEVGGFDEDLTAFVDSDFLFRLGERYDHRIVHRILVEVRLHPGEQLTDPTPRRADALARLLAKNAAYLRRHPRLRRSLYRKLARLEYHLGWRRKGRRTLALLLRARPWDLGVWKTLVGLEVFGRSAPRHRQASGGPGGRETR